MLNDIHAQGSAAESRRLLAVVAPRAEQPAAINRQFSQLGEQVEVVWYLDSRQLLAATEKPHFDAVIMFPSSPDTAAADADEGSLRHALLDTPLYRVEA